MAKFTIDTKEKTLSVVNMKITSNEELADFVSGLISAGKALDWHIEFADEESDEDGGN